MTDAPICEKCSGALIDVDRRPGRDAAQFVLAVCPARVWAECDACGKRMTVLATLRWLLKPPITSGMHQRSDG